MKKLVLLAVALVGLYWWNGQQKLKQERDLWAVATDAVDN